MHDSQLRESIRKAVSHVLEIELGSDQIKLGDVPKGTAGDVSIACFAIAAQVKTDVSRLASTIANHLQGEDFVVRATASGGYVNVTLPANTLFQDACNVVEMKPGNAGGERIMIEYLSPNTNKPLHLGHVRNGVLGSLISNILEAVGHKVIRAILINDRGIHICQSMLAWERFFQGQTPSTAKRKPDHFVGDCYVRYHAESALDPTLEDSVVAMLQQWEAGDEKVRNTWAMMNGWVYEGFDETCNRFGFHFDARYLESNTYLLGKDIIEQGLLRGVLERSPDGSIIFRLKEAEFGLLPDGTERVATVLRGDDTSVYLTQDVGTAVLKADEYGLDRSVYVVACEQQHHFHVLFEILKELGYIWSSKCHHLSYEMVELPHGKMKSREGTVIDADNLADHMASLAADEIRLRDTESCLEENEVLRRANVVGLSAIKFYLLRVGSQRRIMFDPEGSLSMVGDTGPYCLYTYARIQGVLRRAPCPSNTVDLSRLGGSEERDLALQLLAFPKKIEQAAGNYNVSILANHMLAIVKSFNRFYSNCRIATEEDAGMRDARIVLTRTTGEIIEQGLNLLGIEVLDEM